MTYTHYNYQKSIWAEWEEAQVSAEVDGIKIIQISSELWGILCAKAKKSHKKPELPGRRFNFTRKPLFQRLASRGAPGTPGFPRPSGTRGLC
jgi:hypothetical protein